MGFSYGLRDQCTQPSYYLYDLSTIWTQHNIQVAETELILNSTGYILARWPSKECMLG